MRLGLKAPRRFGSSVHRVAQPVRQGLDRVAEVGRDLHGLVRERRVHAGLLEAKVRGQRLGDRPKARGDGGFPLVWNFGSWFGQVVLEPWRAGGRGSREFHLDRPQPQHLAREVAEAEVAAPRGLGRARGVDAGDHASPSHLDSQHSGVRTVEQNFAVEVGNRQERDGEQHRVQHESLRDVNLAQHRIREVSHRERHGPRAAQARRVTDDGSGADQDAHGEKSRAEEDNLVREIRRVDRVGEEPSAEQVMEHHERQLDHHAVHENDAVPVHDREPGHGPRREVQHPPRPHERRRGGPVAHHGAHHAGDGGGENDDAAERGFGDVLVYPQRRA